MTLDTQASPLATLQSIGIINAEHHRRALADPHATELDGLPGLADNLIWLIGRDIVSDQDLRNACTYVAGVYEGEEQDRYGDILEQALAAMAHAGRSLNHKSMATLRATGLLTQAEHDLLLPKIPPERALATPAAALAWIDHTGQLPRARVLQIRHALTDGDGERSAVLQELLVLDQERKAQLGAFWRDMLPPWMWIALPLLAVGAYLWFSA
ncbi:hypothetical protein [Duganella aceris]|uniref:Uncharacterized protein n=1 Tax=Duganella aceris TaxID=2703883 RepID=A0ABX0FHN9_9BURK|nr:hypothetical protein [Duganella aceris]NGZ84030.1 hypothetical protein [Duganella aceris]